MSIPEIKKDIDYFSKTVPHAEAAYRFVSILHKESISTRCNAVRLIIDANNADHSNALLESSKEGSNKTISSFASNVIADLISWNSDGKIKEMEAPGIYISLHNFRGYKRIASHCHKLNSIYIDIDCHDLSAAEREYNLDKVRNALNVAWDNGTLLRPTVITHSGRGYGLFYVLERSIACIDTTTKLQSYYNFIYDMLIKAYKEA